MTDTFEERAREIAHNTFGYVRADVCDELTAAILTALTEAYERGQRDMRERSRELAADYLEWAKNWGEYRNQKVCQIVQDEIADAIAALPLTTDEKACNHGWVDASNNAVSGAEVCILCHAVRATPDSEKEGGE